MTSEAGQSLLVAVDGSECSRHALEFAIRQGQQRPGTVLHVLTVHTAPRVDGEVQIHMSEARAARLLADHDHHIIDRLLPALETSGVRFEVESREGDPATTIANRASELGCDQIIMGTRGLGRAAGLLLGSVTTRVVHLAGVPVTLVK